MLDPKDIPAFLLVYVFLASGGVFFLMRRSKDWGEAFALFTAAAAFTAVLFLYPAVREGGVLVSSHTFFDFPLAFNFRVDIFSFFMAVIISFLWVAAVLYSRGYMAHNHALDRYYAFLLGLLGAMLGVVMAGDLVGFLIFFEAVAILSYVLVAHEEDPPAMFAGYKYLFLSVAGGLAIFFGIMIIYYLTGSLKLGGAGLLDEPSPLALTAFLAFMVGFGIKAGAFPLHVWLPDAHPAAPAPISALLSGILIKVGAYGFIRVIYEVFGIEYLLQAGWLIILLLMAVITILLGSALALLQDDLKRRLAYSSIAQIGYILLGISLLTERALTGALFHIFAHAMMKGCLFLCAGAVIVQTGKRKISEMQGLGLKMPWTFACFTLASLSMVGIPPFNGFVSKLQLSMGALDVGEPLLVLLLIVSSLLNAAYYFPIVVGAFFVAPRETVKDRLEAPPVMLLPMVLLAVATFFFALLPHNWPLEFAQAIAREIFLQF